MVGDPSGKSATRPRLSKEEVDAHAQSYIEQATRILDPSPGKLEVVRNSEWLAPIDMEAALRLTSQVTVAQMLVRNDFAKRHADGVPISITEFLYPLLQATDSVEVRADVELGGTDQLFNLIMGRDLQKAAGQEPQVVLTTPLLVGLDGEHKMSKSLGNYVGIAEAPAEQFGKIMSIPDAQMPTTFSTPPTGPGRRSPTSSESWCRETSTPTRASGSSPEPLSTCITAPARVRRRRPSSTGSSRTTRRPRRSPNIPSTTRTAPPCR